MTDGGLALAEPPVRTEPAIASGSVARASAPSSSAWAAMRAVVRDLVARRVAPADVEDVVQEVMLAIGTDTEASARNAGYVRGVARKKIADHHRRRAREHARIARLVLEPAEDDDEARTESIAIAAQARLSSVLEVFLELVSDANREAVRAVDLQGRSQAEVARALGVPASTVRTRVQRGRAELRAALHACCVIETDARGRVMTCEPRHTEPCACG